MIDGGDIGAFAFLALKLAAINLTLSGDNAIAMAFVSAGLPDEERRFRVLAACALYVAAMGLLSAFSAAILGLEALRPLAAALLIGIGMRLLRQTPIPTTGDRAARPAPAFSTSVLSLFLTDLAVSPDNVIALGAAGEGHVAATVAGLLLSAPIVIYGSSVIGRLFARIPLLLALGAALLGFIAGNIAASMPRLADWIGSGHDAWAVLIPIATVLLTLTGGRLFSRA